MPPFSPAIPADIADTVRRALDEDIGRGDLSAALVPASETAQAVIISRDDGVVCGIPWVSEVFYQLDVDIELHWLVSDGEHIKAGASLCRLSGSARGLLTGERSALNFLQTLSATATAARRFADAVATTATTVLDTRKTIPGLRSAQKYACVIGGCHNHRLGLDDGILIKENHIAACGGITAAVMAVRQLAPALTRIEVEVETLAQVTEALEAGVDTLLLDNFTLPQLREAVALCAGRARTEASGNVDLNTIADIAATGVDFISTGAITKHIHAVDLSMRFD